MNNQDGAARRIYGSVEDRFFPRVNKDGPVVRPELGPCWVWTACSNARGYGRFSYRGTPTLAHRVSWELHRGAIPDGLSVLHKCDNPPCVRPEHLFLGTMAENNLDKCKKGRWRKGPERYRRKLTPEEENLVAEAFYSGEPQRAIAVRFQVGQTHVRRVARRVHFVAEPPASSTRLMAAA